MPAPIRWGILSTANIGRAAVCPAIRASSNGVLAAVASRDASRAAFFAQANEVPRHHGSYEALLADDAIDAVYIPLPNSMHLEWTVRAAEAGKHVLCEKPLGLTAAECLEMDRAARANGVRLMEAFMYRFHPRTVRMVDLIRGGAIGRLASIRSAFTFRLNRPDNIRLRADLGGGALMDVGCYCVNVSRTLAGEEPVEAVAWARFGPTDVDEELTGMLRFPSGAVAHFDCALTLERREICEAAGPGGSLAVEAAFVAGTGPTTITELRGRNPSQTHVGGTADQYQVMVEHFGDCIVTGTEPRWPATEAAANLAAIEALYRSARAGGRPSQVAVPNDR
ncbi:MAG: Gfo/Idh/MocA family protein [Gemmatimonadales bacterium]